MGIEWTPMNDVKLLGAAIPIDPAIYAAEREEIHNEVIAESTNWAQHEEEGVHSALPKLLRYYKQCDKNEVLIRTTPEVEQVLQDCRRCLEKIGVLDAKERSLRAFNMLETLLEQKADQFFRGLDPDELEAVMEDYEQRLPGYLDGLRLARDEKDHYPPLSEEEIEEFSDENDNEMDTVPENAGYGESQLLLNDMPGGFLAMDDAVERLKILLKLEIE